MRAVLIVNPAATSTTQAGRDVLAHALASEVKLDVVQTRYQGHATDAAMEAVSDHVDMVIAHGGDGTVNEVVNGLLAGRDMFHGVTMPTLGVVPGGSANVFARALGIPKEPIEATHQLLQVIAAQRSRTVGLGKANGRWFTFNAGVGWDADVVAEVERLRADGREATPALYAKTALACYFKVRKQRPLITVTVEGAPPVHDLYTAFVCNTDPWTYLGSMPVRMSPDTTFDTGLGVLSLRTMNTYAVLRHISQMLRSRARPHGRNIFRRADIPRVHVACEVPLRLQVDGDNLGECSSIEFVSVPDALRVAV